MNEFEIEVELEVPEREVDISQFIKAYDLLNDLLVHSVELKRNRYTDRIALIVYTFDDASTKVGDIIVPVLKTHYFPSKKTADVLTEEILKGMLEDVEIKRPQYRTIL